MRGVGGKPGWFWLFLLEGLITLLIGFAVNLPSPSSYPFILLGDVGGLRHGPADTLFGSIELSVPALFSNSDDWGYMAQAMVHRAPRNYHDQCGLVFYVANRTLS